MIWNLSKTRFSILLPKNALAEVKVYHLSVKLFTKTETENIKNGSVFAVTFGNDYWQCSLLSRLFADLTNKWNNQWSNKVILIWTPS